MAKKTSYNLNVDAHNTKAALDQIQQRLEEDVKRDFESGIAPDGSVPRGLLASLARKYGYTSTWITKMLKKQGVVFERKVILS